MAARAAAASSAERQKKKEHAHHSAYKGHRVKGDEDDNDRWADDPAGLVGPAGASGHVAPADGAQGQFQDREGNRGQADSKLKHEPSGIDDLKFILPHQKLVYRKYDSKASQVGIAGIIFLNFFISIAKAQVLPEEGSPDNEVFVIFEWVFNIIFGLELLVNMYANWYCRFWSNGWNVFDFIIVGVSWLAMLAGNLPGISVLRLLRAFRVFRLFKRVPDLRKIIIGILKSLPGIANAFVVLGLIMGMWSVMGVTFFSHDFPDEFGNFFKSMLTMVQLMTYDSWVSGITRPMVLFYQDPLVALYFVSYAFVTTIIMANVLIAILVDKYTESSKEIEEAEARDKALAAGIDEPEEDTEEALDPVVMGALKEAQDEISARVREIVKQMESLYPEPIQPKKMCDWKPLPHQEEVRRLFESPLSQVVLSLVILVNFIGSAVQAQIKPLEGSSEQLAFSYLEYVFNTIFLIELVVNIYANFARRFFRNGWNIFDAVVVVVGWMAMLSGNSDVAVLRMFRAFRRSVVAFRVVKLLKIAQLKVIVMSAVKSLPGVFNAFVLLAIVMGIWSIMGVSFYKDLYQEEFGNFALAMLTMLQIMSFDSWASGIARPVILDDEVDSIKASIFFMTYVFASAIIMNNVVLAILIDKFLSTQKEFTTQENLEKAIANSKHKEALEKFAQLHGQEPPPGEDETPLVHPMVSFTDEVEKCMAEMEKQMRASVKEIRKSMQVTTDNPRENDDLNGYPRPPELAPPPPVPDTAPPECLPPRKRPSSKEVNLPGCMVADESPATSPIKQDLRSAAASEAKPKTPGLESRELS